MAQKQARKKRDPRKRPVISKALSISAWHVKIDGKATFSVAIAGDMGQDFMCMMCGQSDCDLLLLMANGLLGLRKFMGMHRACTSGWDIEIDEIDDGNDQSGDVDYRLGVSIGGRPGS